MTVPAAPPSCSPEYTQASEIDMKDILLSMPEFYLYLVFVVTLLIVAVGTRQTDPPVDEPRPAALTSGRGVAEALVAGRGNLDRPHWRDSAWPTQRDRRLFRDLETTLSANYAARLEQAIRTIRVGPPAGG
jgi:hypothetical protein